MVQVYELSKLPQTLWKNQKGKTVQIAIEPENAHFPDESFDWRISCADIQEDSPFSAFVGYQRTLAVWKGHGILLNGQRLLPFKSLNFDGDQPQDCKLIQGPVRDIGIIYNPFIIRCELSFQESSQTDFEIKLIKGEIVFLFCIGGTLRFANQEIPPESILRIGNEPVLKYQMGPNTKLIKISIKKLKT